MIQAILKAVSGNWLNLALAAAMVVCFGAGWEVNGWRWEAKHSSELQEQIDARQAQERVAQKVSAALEEKLATIQTTNRELNKRLAHETNKPDYRCRVPDAGVQLRSDAVSLSPSVKSDRTVSGNP